MKFLLVVAFLGLASAASVGQRRGIVRDGVEYFPIEDHMRAHPELYPQLENLPPPPPPAADQSERIVGGNVATHGQFKYQVALFLATSTGNFFCGGIIIGRNTVLTAAHCVYPLANLRSVRVVAGAQNVQQSESQQREFTVPAADVVHHPQYNTQNLRNDIAVINIAGGIGDSNDYIDIANLPRKSQAGDTYANQQATTSGWGRPSDSSGSISPTLRWVQTSVISNQQCNSIYGIVTDGHVCLAGDGGRGSCNGDSGGPTVIEGHNGPQTVIGCVSFGASAGCEAGYPHAYTKVIAFASWIEGNSPVRFQD